MWEWESLERGGPCGVCIGDKNNQRILGCLLELGAKVVSCFGWEDLAPLHRPAEDLVLEFEDLFVGLLLGKDLVCC